MCAGTYFSSNFNYNEQKSHISVELFIRSYEYFLAVVFRLCILCDIFFLLQEERYSHDIHCVNVEHL